jgi:hypothetical protein
MAAKLTSLTHKNSDTTAPSGRELYHLQFSLQAASPETFGYTLFFYMHPPQFTRSHYAFMARIVKITR